MKKHVVFALCIIGSTLLVIFYGLSSLAVKITKTNINWINYDYFYPIVIFYLLFLLVTILVYFYILGKTTKEVYTELSPRQKKKVNSYIWRSLKVIGKFIVNSLKKRDDKLGTFVRHVEDS